MKELLEFIFTRKKFWLLPIVIVLLLFGFFIIIAPAASVGPFIYTLF
ncbi:DUF5989 family protein [Halobacteriovorax sp. HLS]